MKPKHEIYLRRNKLYDENVFSIGVLVAGARLNNAFHPFKLILEVGVFSHFANYKTTTILLDTDFSKAISHYAAFALKGNYPMFNNVFTNFEGTKIKLPEINIDHIVIKVKCKDKNDAMLFESEKLFKPESIISTWETTFTKDSMRVFFGNGNANTNYTQIVDELYSSYRAASSVLKLSYSNAINVYLSEDICDIYDLVSAFPLFASSSAAFGKTTIVIALDGREELGIAFSPHEFAHLLINQAVYEMGPAEKVFVEGICEFASEKYHCEKGWLLLEERSEIGYQIVKSLGFRDLKEWLSTPLNFEEDGIEYYLILPVIVRELINYCTVSIHEMIRAFGKNCTVFDLLTNMVADPDDFLYHVADSINFSQNGTMDSSIYQGYASKHKIFFGLHPDMTQAELHLIQELDIQLQKMLLCGDGEGALRTLEGTDSDDEK